MTGIMALVAHRGEISAEGEHFSGGCDVASRNRLVHFGVAADLSPRLSLRRLTHLERGMTIDGYAKVISL
jgi:hypothetical protein